MIYTNLNRQVNKKEHSKINKKMKLDWVAPNSILELISLREYHKFVLVKFNIKVGYPLNTQPNINAIIGPYGVNVINLQKKLEYLNEIFEVDTTIPILLKVYDFDKYTIQIRSPYLSYFLQNMGGSSNFVSIYQVYELVKKKKKDLNLSHISEYSLYYSILGFLKSGNINIYYDDI